MARMSFNTWLGALLACSPLAVTGCAGGCSSAGCSGSSCAPYAASPPYAAPQPYAAGIDPSVPPGSAAPAPMGYPATAPSRGAPTMQNGAAPPSMPPMSSHSHSHQAAAPAVAYGGQKVCPVTGEKLGSMGPPLPVTVKGETIYVCCQGCVEEVQSNPDEYLAKVRAQ